MKVNSYTVLFLTGFLLTGRLAAQDVTPPDTPKLDSVSVYNSATGETIISWYPSDSADVQKYIVYRSISAIWQPIATVNAPATFYIDNTADADFHTELYRIAASDEANNISPMTPQNDYHNTMYIFPYQEQNNCQCAVRLGWNPYINWPEGMLEYRIYVQENGGPYSLLGTVAGNTVNFFHEPVNDNTSYCYYVRAISNNGRTSTSNQTCIFTSCPDFPSFINMDYVTLGPDNQLFMSFTLDATADVKNYRLIRWLAGTTAESIIGQYINVSGASLQTTDKPDIGKSWMYRLEAIDPCGNTVAISNTGRSMTTTCISDMNLTQTIRWDPYQTWNGGLERYNIYRLVDNEPPVLAGSITSGDTVFVDNVAGYADISTRASGHFCYYVEAVEGDANPYGVKGLAISAISCAYQMSRVFVPNSFTPNGDVLNGSFKPSVLFVKTGSYHFTVFDRWGMKVFETKDPLEGWNGMYKGKPQAEGVYVYKLIYTSTDDKIHEKAGLVHLLMN